MRSKFIVLITLLLSATGLALQCWCQATAFDAGALPLPGAPALGALKLFAVAVPVLAVLLSLPLHGRRPQGEHSLYAGMGGPGRAAGILAGALMLLGGALALSGNLSPLQSAACVVDALLMVGGGAMIRLALSSGQDSHHSLWALLPGFAGCFWLVIYYHSHSRDAVVLRYCWVLLCLIAAILALYYQAGFAFDRKRPLRGLACTMTAAVYAFTALPDSDSLSEALLLLGIGVWMLLHCVLIPRRSQVHGHREEHI